VQKVAVGTLKEIADQHSNVRDIIAISLTRCAALMRERAEKAADQSGRVLELQKACVVKAINVAKGVLHFHNEV